MNFFSLIRFLFYHIRSPWRFKTLSVFNISGSIPRVMRICESVAKVLSTSAPFQVFDGSRETADGRCHSI